MGKKEKISQSEIDGIDYRRAKKWQFVLLPLNNAASMCFYILVGMASYLANAGYGIAVAVVGLILTGTRIFDGITDPIIALVVDKVNTRFGKIRLFLIIGCLIETLAVFMLFVWCSGRGHGIVMFIAVYLVYVIGYTINNVAGQIIPSVTLNDPKQRPMFQVWGTVYGYLVPMIMTLISTMVVLPKYGNQYTVEMLAECCIIFVAISFVFEFLCCIALGSVDKPENFRGISVKGKDEKVSVRDMLKLIKENKALLTFIVSATSDKLAQQAGGQAIVSTMFYGILIGNMQLGTMISMIAMLPSILFAIVGAKYAGKHGNKEATVAWTRISLIIGVISVIFGASGSLTSVSKAVIPTVIFFVLTLGLNGAKMCVTMANGAMCLDIIDYEVDRSGKYMPAAVTATYMFIDKLVSSLGAAIATACVALIGYTSVMPQPTDQSSPAILWMTMFLLYGLPIMGWICTLVAMKFNPLSKGKMVEVQKNIQDKKKAMETNNAAIA